MYRTGDTARYFPEGNIEFLGRKDFQVKVRGYRIELGEIEHALRSHSDVVEALAEVRQDSPGDQKLVAYAVLKAGTAPSIKALKKHAAAVLPDYMVPNVIGFLEAFPLTANGKVDRKALPWPVRMSGNKIPDKELKLSVDKNIIKTAVLNIIREVIQTDELGADGDMFDFGVTSLNLIQIAEKIREQQGLTIRAEVFLDNPTPAGIAAYLQTVSDGPSTETSFSEQQSGSDLSLQPDFSGPVTIELEDVAFNQEAYLMRSSCRRFSSGSILLTCSADCFLFSGRRSWTMNRGIFIPLQEDSMRFRPIYPSGKTRIDGLGEGDIFL